MRWLLVLISFASAGESPYVERLQALVPDLRLAVIGEWDEAARERLAAALAEVATTREPRAADPLEVGVVRHLRLRLGETLSVESEYRPLLAPGAARTPGDPGDEVTTFTFPRESGEATMRAFLTAHLPPALADEAPRLPSWCEKLLGLLRKRY